MKISKFLPLALALVLATPASFAAASGSQTSEMTLNVGEFINITMDETVKTSACTFPSDTYSQINLSTPFDVTFHVVNNKVDRPIYLTAKAGTGDFAALGGTAENPILAFANTTCAVKPTETQIKNAVSDSASIAGNPNVIAFTLEPTISPSEAASAQPAASLADNKLTYTLKNGRYDFRSLAGANAAANTFSTHDENGTYMTTLTLSTAGL